MNIPDTVSLSESRDCIRIIDQTLLPSEMKIVELRTAQEIWDAIYRLRVRGAPAIGVAAAFGICLCAAQIRADSYDAFRAAFLEQKAYLASARPTAVNLFWALDRIQAVVDANPGDAPCELLDRLFREAAEIRDEDARVCERIGENALTLLRDGQGILTHCNAGRLATIRYGTALAPVYLGAERGVRFRVYCDETRPLLQGARLTAWELSNAGIDTTLICDNMASAVMQKGLVSTVLTGADRIAVNGDAANKIGTSGLAVLARHYGIPFYICAPLSTFDPACADGNDIPVEERPPEEVSELWFRSRMAPQGIAVFNPAFDVTDHSLITGIVTEHGVLSPPYDQSIPELLSRMGR